MMRILLRPLWWRETPLPGEGGPSEVTAEGLLDFLRGPLSTTTLAELKIRYDELAVLDHKVLAVPKLDLLVDRIVRPIHNSKAAYVLGHFPSCIAQAGLVAEMLAILKFSINDVVTRSGPLDEARQKLLWGRKFVDLGQKDRIGALLALGLISEDASGAFHELSGIRRAYMHFLDRKQNREQPDAKRAYELALDIFVSVIGPQVQPGSSAIHFNDDVFRWARKNGL